MNAIKVVEEAYKKEMPNFRVGDTISVNMKIKEGDKERVQAFTGVVIGRKGDGTRETFMVRKISYGVGVEKIFPLYSPLIESIKVVKEGRVRRAKLYYLRGKKGKAAKVKEKAFTVAQQQK
ncbi:MAG: 50S ribosomal protein L19 [Nitrospiraceae bacterium]|nr:MAG: 50S ribosomal protein L19 [Nitrospiraceae bacterium]